MIHKSTSLEHRPPPAPLEYAGQWVAWNREHTQIVAHGEKLVDVHRAAVAAGHPRAILQKVRRGLHRCDMKFSYRQIIAQSPDADDYYLILRPEIPVTIAGPSGEVTIYGLLDTGSDNTIFPLSLADYLGISLYPSPDPPASVFGGQKVELLLGDVVLKLEVGSETIAWPTTVCFFDFLTGTDETAILGHAGFLDYFTATFDGENSLVTLLANRELPVG
jgi:hypothetical protein